MPLLFLLAVLKFTDSFTLVKWRHISYSLCAGVAVCMAAVVVARACDRWGVLFYSPLFEEVLKFGVLVWLVLRRKIVFVQQALCYGAAIGAGFAFAENIIYINAFADMELGTALFRGLGTAVMHMVCPMTAATVLTCGTVVWEESGAGMTSGKDVSAAGDYGSERVERGGKVAGLTALEVAVVWIAGLGLAVGIHALFNMMLVQMWLQIGLTLLVFGALVVLISEYNERRVNRWLDQSINNDIALLKAIRGGQLSQTRQGQYLLTVRSQFTPEVIADMMCYIGLYLELIIDNKSRLMLREAGLETPRTPEQTAARRAALAEFYELRRRIGKSGESILRPIVRVGRDDAALIKDMR